MSHLMHGILNKTVWPAALLLCAAMGCGRIPESRDSSFVVCTWTEEDTSTTLAVNFSVGPEARKAAVYYDTQSGGGDPAKYSSKTQGRPIKVTGLRGFRMFQAELTGLEPGTTYYFIAGNPEQGFREERKVRTLPAGDEPLKIVAGGDIGIKPEAVPFLRTAAALSPDFVLIGGDISYGSGKVSRWNHWITWLQNWDRNMVTPDGYTVPFAASPGNHEVEIDVGVRKAPFYKTMLAQSRKPYFRRRFGSALDVYLLDSDHLVTRTGAQLRWLEKRLEEDKDRSLKFALYHVAIYPCGVREDPVFELKEGKAWLALFDRYRLHTAFEHHCHALKRSHPLVENRLAREGEWGTLYLGDGGFGMPVRAVDTNRWYLAHAETVGHFWFVEIGPETIDYRAVAIDGKTLDACSRPRRMGP